jgi:hypothetical protein
MDIICQHCGCVNEYETVLTEAPHYAKAVCIHCKSFIQWLPNPNGNFKTRCKEQIDRALTKQPNNTFFKSLKTQFDAKGFISPKQFEAINKF